MISQCPESPVLMTLAQFLPEKEDIKGDSDWIAFSPDSNCFQNPRIAKLGADQFHVKHARLLKVYTHSDDLNLSKDIVKLLTTINSVTAVSYLVLVWLYASHKIWVGSVIKNNYI